MTCNIFTVVVSLKKENLFLTSISIDISHLLVERCKNGDRKAQRELYDMYARSMFNICMRMVNHSGEAEDILQEAFLEAFNKIDTFRGEATIGAWLKRIVVHKCINHLRRIRPVLIDEIHEQAGGYTEEVTHDTGEQQWEVKRVMSAIARLPDGYRVVLSLHLLEGYDHAEIAQVLNITENTVRTQYKRAKDKVKQLLNVTSYER